MSLEQIRDSLPDYARDIRLNLGSVLTPQGAPGLTEKQIHRPFVGVVSAAPVFSPSEAEIAEVLSYPLDELMAAETTVEWPRDGLGYRGIAYPMGDGNTIWGATATIVNELMAIVRSRS